MLFNLKSHAALKWQWMSKGGIMSNICVLYTQ
jgi:hypothetical protein